MTDVGGEWLASQRAVRENSPPWASPPACRATKFSRRSQGGAHDPLLRQVAAWIAYPLLVPRPVHPIPRELGVQGQRVAVQSPQGSVRRAGLDPSRKTGRSAESLGQARQRSLQRGRDLCCERGPLRGIGPRPHGDLRGLV